MDSTDIQKRYKFKNGYGASVIWNPHSYGYDEGLWELAVLDRDGRIDYSTSLGSEVLGYLNDADVENVLEQISHWK